MGSWICFSSSDPFSIPSSYYLMSKKSWPISCSKLLYKTGQDLLYSTYYTSCIIWINIQFAIDSEDETETKKNVAPVKTVVIPPPHKDNSISVMSSPLKSDKAVTAKSALKKNKLGKDKPKAEAESIPSKVATSKTALKALNTFAKSEKSRSNLKVEATKPLKSSNNDDKVSSDSSKVKKVCPTSDPPRENNVPLPKKTKLPAAVPDVNAALKTPVTEMSQNKAAGAVKPQAMSSAHLHSQSHCHLLLLQFSLC